MSYPRSQSPSSLPPLAPPAYASSTTISSPASPISSDLLTKTIYRARFTLRLLSAVFSAGLIGALAMAAKSYHETKDRFLLWEGRNIWPERVDLKSVDGFFGFGGALLGLSSLLLVASVWPKVRKLTTLGNAVGAAVSGINFILAIAAVVFFYQYSARKGSWTLWQWSCEHTAISLPDIQFMLVCSEIRFSWAMSIAVAATETLCIACCAASFIIVRRVQMQGFGKLSEKP